MPPEHPQGPAPPERQPELVSTSQNIFFWGGSMATAIEAGAGAATDPPWPPKLPAPSWPPEFQDPPWPPKSPDPS